MTKITTDSELINKINEILYKEDPIRLIGRGGISDEYLPEAKMIFTQLPQAKDEKQLYKLIIEIFNKQFFENIGDKLIYQKIVKEINTQLGLEFIMDWGSCTGILDRKSGV